MNLDYRNISNHTLSYNEEYKENQLNTNGSEKVNNLDAIYIDPKVIAKVSLESNIMYKKMQEFDYLNVNELKSNFAQVQSKAITQERVSQLLCCDK